MSRQRILPGAVAAAAIDIVDREGLDALNLSSVAGLLGVGPSALYSHVPGLDGLRHLLAVSATNNLTAWVRDAAIGIAGPGALESVGSAYRSFAHQYPGQYASTLLPSIAADDDLAMATRALLDVFSRVYRGYGLSGPDAVLAAGTARSAMHGFVALEMATGRTPTHDQQYRHLLGTLHRGLDDPRRAGHG